MRTLYEFAVDTMEEAIKVITQVDPIGMVEFNVECDPGCEPPISLTVIHEHLSEETLRGLVLALPRGIALASYITQFKSR